MDRKRIAPQPSIRAVGLHVHGAGDGSFTGLGLNDGLGPRFVVEECDAESVSFAVSRGDVGRAGGRCVARPGC